ncbi:TPA: DUF6957 family protein [Pseudomonas aeruginosa]|nr:hypothetical protein [Pseudomonas aeruginosa]HCJ6265383.1 hypothetical protein [Pseudomonas aeruginosa]
MSIEDELVQQLQRDGRLLNGTPMKGCELSEPEILDMLAQQYPRQPYCLVKDWLLVDLEGLPEELDAIQAHGFEPRLVFAHSMLRDSRMRFAPGSWIRTTFQVALDEAAGIFVSRNTVYVLVGPGFRKSVPLSIVLRWR